MQINKQKEGDFFYHTKKKKKHSRETNDRKWLH